MIQNKDEMLTGASTHVSVERVFHHLLGQILTGILFHQSKQGRVHRCFWGFSNRLEEFHEFWGLVQRPLDNMWGEKRITHAYSSPCPECRSRIGCRSVWSALAGSGWRSSGCPFPPRWWCSIRRRTTRGRDTSNKKRLNKKSVPREK